MKPDSTKHNPNPQYIRALIERSGLSQRKVADTIGIGDRTLRAFLQAPGSPGYRVIPYTVQFAIERLCDD